MAEFPASSTQVSTQRPCRRILVVEREANHRLYLTTLLQRFGYSVTGVSSAARAWERIGAATPSFIIAAFGIVGAEDLAFLEHLQRDRRTAAVSVLAVTSAGDFVTESRCRSSGVMTCFPRPVPAEELYRAVQQAVEATPRQNLRIPLKLPVFLNNRPLDCPEQGCDAVLSAKGMFVQTGRPRRENERVIVRFPLGQRPVSADAIVLDSGGSGSAPGRETGMRLAFVRISADDESYIRRFIQDEVTQGLWRREEGPSGRTQVL